MAGEVVVDALPYIDQGYEEPGVREAALAMVDEETRRYRPTKNYLEHLPQLNLSAFETEILKVEFERMQQRQPMDLLSMKRYELPPPPAGKMTDIAAWTECVENSMAQLEHQATRICNLELMLDYGCEAWKSYLEVLIQLVLQAQKQLQNVRKQIQETNWQRKNEQLHAGERLRQLESTWVGLVSKNYEIEQACAMLEKDVMRSRYYARSYSPEPEIITLDLDDPEEPMEVDEIQYVTTAIVSTAPVSAVRPTIVQPPVQPRIQQATVKANVPVAPVRASVQARVQVAPVSVPILPVQAPIVHAPTIRGHVQGSVQNRVPVQAAVQPRVQAQVQAPVQPLAPVQTTVQPLAPVQPQAPIQTTVQPVAPIQATSQAPAAVQAVAAPMQTRSHAAVQTPTVAPVQRYLNDSPIEDKDDSTTDDDDDTDDVVDEDSEEEPPLGMLRASSPF